MKREVFISVLFLLGLKRSGNCLPFENEFCAINHAVLLSVKPKHFITENLSVSNSGETIKCYLPAANNPMQSSGNNTQLLQPYCILTGEINSVLDPAIRKQNYKREKKNKFKTITIKTNSGLPKVPP